MKNALLCSVALALLTASACTTAPTTTGGTPAPTPTPAPVTVGRVNPYVIEETETHTIQRYPKEQYIRVDDRHIRHPNLASEVEFFREDDKYYYVSVPKHLPEEEELKRQTQPTPTPRSLRSPEEGPDVPGPGLSDFADLTPPRSPARVRLEKVAASGLPAEGMWRASFVLADVNEDSILDIVSPPARIGGNPVLHIWIGDGTGKFTRWPLRFTERGRDQADPGLDYGGVAVGDIDGDGHMDVAAASHGGGVASFFGDGKGGFRVDRRGLPGREYSAQAVILVDADRDGHLDMVTSRDIIDTTEGQGVDRQQIRVYVYRPEGWIFKTDGLVGGLYSNSLQAWDYDGDGAHDVLTGSHYNGGMTLVWRNAGGGEFAPVSISDLEIYAYHFASAAGTHGTDRAPAFVDAYYMTTNKPEPARAAGLTLYAFRGGKWSRHRVWRKKDGRTSQYGVAMGDLDGDRLDDIVFPDSELRRLRIFFQKADGSFLEAAESEEPAIDSPGQCVRLADLDRDGRLDVVLSKSPSSSSPGGFGGWDVYLNRR